MPVDRMVLSVLYSEPGKYSATVAIRESGATRATLRDCSGFLVDERDTTCDIRQADLVKFAEWVVRSSFDVKNPEVEGIHWYKRAIELKLSTIRSSDDEKPNH